MNEQSSRHEELVDLFNPESQISEEALREMPFDEEPGEKPEQRVLSRAPSVVSTGPETGQLNREEISLDLVLAHPGVTIARARLRHSRRHQRQKHTTG